MKKKISIIGCGAIGSELAQNVDSNMAENVILLSLLDIRLENL
jgi:predicted dinucleotide-utilizing enzyme